MFIIEFKKSVHIIIMMSFMHLYANDNNVLQYYLALVNIHSLLSLENFALFVHIKCLHHNKMPTLLSQLNKLLFDYQQIFIFILRRDIQPKGKSFRTTMVKYYTTNLLALTCSNI